MVALEYVSEEVVKDFIIYVYRENFNRYFETKKHIPEGNLAEIRYEEFIGNETEVLHKAYQILGLNFEAAEPHIKAEVKSYEGYQTNKYEYDPERMEEIYAAWKSVFEELGYSK